MSDQKTILVGKITGAFGIKGWVKIFSYTNPRENILSYSPWFVKKDTKTKQIDIIDGNVQGQFVVASIDGISDRDAAEELRGWEIFITAEQLPEADSDEYYWADLIGLKVETTQGVQLGVVDSLMGTGANDVLIVHGERDRAIPFLQGQTISKIDLAAGIIIVDWDPDF